MVEEKCNRADGTRSRRREALRNILARPEAEGSGHQSVGQHQSHQVTGVNRFKSVFGRKCQLADELEARRNRCSHVPGGTAALICPARWTHRDQFIGQDLPPGAGA